MRVRVLRKSNMPHNVQIWFDDQPDVLIYYIDAQLLTADGARFMEAALNVIVAHWHRSPNVAARPHLRLHTG